jgi:hypothetical protein
VWMHAWVCVCVGVWMPVCVWVCGCVEKCVWVSLVCGCMFECVSVLVCGWVCGCMCGYVGVWGVWVGVGPGGRSTRVWDAVSEWVSQGARGC